MTRLELQFPPDHPTATGHFPGNPIIPGALLLAEVLQLISTSEALDLSAGKVTGAKFLHPVRPGDTVKIEYKLTAVGNIQFECGVAATRVLSGIANIAHE